MLFPAELHPQVSQLSLAPAELEHKDSKSSVSPAELEHKDSTATTSTGPNELSAEPEEQPAGPYELHGKEIEAITAPPSPVKFDENRRWPFTHAEHVGPTGAEDSSSALGGRQETEVGMRNLHCGTDLVA